jgi:uncharacterized repeat protein (TIGR03803 family)
MCTRFSLRARFVFFAASAFLIGAVVARAADSLSILHQFDNSGGYSPGGDLISDSAGNLYGTTFSGGEVSENCLQDCGVVFEVSPSGGQWTYQILYSFTGGSDGGEPSGRLALDSKGNLYGTASAGGTVNETYCPAGCGTVFELSPSAGRWTFALLHSFSGSDGMTPISGLTLGGARNLYGAAEYGGSAGGGVVFELSPSGSNWTFSILHSFDTWKYGFFPFTGIAVDGAGNLYGGARAGGSSNSFCSSQNGCGTVFRISASGVFSVVHVFQGTTHGDGWFPTGTLAIDSSGNVYGTTSFGGTAFNFCGSGCGTVYELSPSSGKWKKKAIRKFTGSDGSGPRGGVTLDTAGDVLGTTQFGGANGEGTIFRFAHGRNNKGWKFTSLYSFTGNADGGQPTVGVIADSLGNLYGASQAAIAPFQGAVFELSTH